MADKPKTLLAQVRDRLRLKNYRYATEKSYIGWIRRYLLFHQKRHPAAMGRAEVEAFLTHLAEAVNASGFRQSNMHCIHRFDAAFYAERHPSFNSFIHPNKPITNTVALASTACACSLRTASAFYSIS
jgi:hypothetical protein